jgi:hypothetical protein
MLTILDGILSLTVVALALAVLVISAVRGYVRRYFFLNFYVAVMLLVDGLRYVALWRFGYSSLAYFNVFFLTDAILVASIYLVILSFFEVVFEDTPLAGYVRWALLFFVILVGAMSYAMVAKTQPFYSRLIVEFSQNMYFAAVLLSVMLWISLQHLQVDDRLMGFLIAGLGLSLGLQTAACAAQNLLPQYAFSRWQWWDAVLARVSTLTTILKLGLWSYALGGLAHDVLVVEREGLLREAEAKGGA